MRAEALKRAMAFVPLRPVIQFPPQIANLLPKQKRSPITTAALEFDNGCRDFDNSCVEINRTACRQLKRFACARNHSTSHQAAGITKDLFWTPSASVDDKIKFRLQPDDRPRRRCTKPANAKTIRVAFYS